MNLSSGHDPDRHGAPAQPAKNDSAPPLRAAKGDDDLMSQQPQQSLPSADQIMGVWKQQVGAARITWGKLTDDELLQTQGHIQKLAGLVQERYAVSRDEAETQIRRFFEKHKRA